MGQPLGESAGQQTWEALAVLVALRAWAHRWQGRRVVLRVRSDSVSALTLVLAAKAKGRGPAIIAREVALDLAEMVYRPDVVSHIPGLANVAADKLSRLAQPGTSASWPTYLSLAECQAVPARGASLCRASRVLAGGMLG